MDTDRNTTPQAGAAERVVAGMAEAPCPVPEDARGTEVRPAVSVVLRSCQGREGLLQVIARVHGELRSVRHEIVLVDGDTGRGGPAEMPRAVLDDLTVRVVPRTPGRRGRTGVLEGLQAARAERILVAGVEGASDVTWMSPVLRALDTDDLVVGSRRVVERCAGLGGVLRHLGRGAVRWLNHLVLNVPLRDPTSECFGVRRAAYLQVAHAMRPREFALLPELYYRLALAGGQRTVACREVPLQLRDRPQRRTAWGGGAIWRYAHQLLALRREGPLPQGLPKFIGVGSMGFTVNLSTLWVLVHVAGWHYLYAGATAIQVAMLHNFVWHDRWTFKPLRSNRPWVVRLLRFEVAMTTGMTLNLVMLGVLVERLGLPVLAAHACGGIAAAFVNYTFCKLWAWKGGFETSASGDGGARTSERGL